jgi:hypothetical protein
MASLECTCGHRYECPCGCQSCPACDVPEFRSRVAGAIGRGLSDAARAAPVRSVLNSPSLGPEWQEGRPPR